MILITGATGFVGRALVPRLVEGGLEVRCLIRPSRRTPRLPKGMPLQISIASLSDERGLRAALVGVDTVFHLAGAEWHGRRSDVFAVDAAGTRTLVEAAREAGVGRLIYLSHLGADRASAFAVLKAKGVAEEFIRQSGVPYTILRSALLYGEEDVFLNVVAALLKLGPGFFLMPGDGKISLQPLWVEDLVTCLEWSLSDLTSLNQTFSIGGPEFITFDQMVQTAMDVIGVRRLIVPMHPQFLRVGAWLLENLLPRSPLTTHWLDYLAINRTCEVSSVSRYFGLKPARFVNTLDYLRHKRWWPEMARLIGGTSYSDPKSL